MNAESEAGRAIDFVFLFFVFNDTARAAAPCATLAAVAIGIQTFIPLSESIIISIALYISIPRGQLTVITGLSGSGKSSLAFDTIFAEGQRRYMDTFSSYARGFIGQMQRPDVDKISGLSPVISIDQRTTGRNPRSTVGTVTEVYDFLRLLYARAGEAYSYLSGKKMVQLTDEQIVSIIQEEYQGQKILLLSPLVNRRKGHYKELFDSVRKKGFVYVRVDGEVQELYQGMKVDRYSPHTIEVVVDRLAVSGERLAEEEDVRRLRQSVPPRFFCVCK